MITSLQNRKIPNRGKLGLRTSLLKHQIMKEKEANVRELRFLGEINTTNDRTLKTLGTAIKSASRVQKLDIQCQRMATNLAGQIANITNEITEKGLFYLGNKLRRLSSLQALNITFLSCPKINDVGLDHIGKALKNLSSLERLSLNFSSCSLITDTGLENIGKGLHRLVSLKSLNLNFTLCERITDAGLHVLVKNLKGLGDLQNISLNFSSCDQIVEAGPFRIVEGLKRVKPLRSLELTFAWSNW